MEKYGCTVRKIRLNKGFSQKEIYTGILSKSFAIDFEKGNYDIKFCAMMRILDRLMITTEELLLIHNEYAAMPGCEPLMDINLERLKSDPAYSLEVGNTLYADAQASKTTASTLKYKEFLALKAVYENSDYQKSQEFREAKKYIQRYLFDIETWTFAECRIFSDMSFLFDEGEGLTSLFLTAWESLEKYKCHPDFSIYLAHLLVNNLYRLIRSGEYALAQRAIARGYELTADINLLSWRTPLLYYEGLLCCRQGETEQGLAKIEKAKAIYRMSGHDFMAAQMDIGLQAL